MIGLSLNNWPPFSSSRQMPHNPGWQAGIFVHSNKLKNIFSNYPEFLPPSKTCILT